ncbi:MAG: RagB/SusD family nutrient uptake outer membrane protein [Butyricimonas faecalis]
MKKLINKSIILSLVVALTACNDWLNVSPKTDMKAEDLFSTEAGFRDALIGVYALMATSNLYGKNLSYGYLDVLAQYYTSPRSNTSTGYEHNLKNAAAYNYTESDEESRILSIWSSHFSAIANINQALLFIDENRDVFTSEDIHHIYKGEFLALRALLHFNVLRLFAPSPMMDNQNGLNAFAIPYVEQYTNIAQPQLTVKEVLEKIVKDLLTAKNLMKEREIFNEFDSSSPMYKRNQRMNYYAVTALLARVYLYENDKKSALTEVKEIIGEVDGENPTSYTLATSGAL